ncbi:MAG: hypothetical protein LBQ66_01570 [Planctomycetaceae bacterium]|nr:hypothetical protein [Planctomycetaceae bacterium]
MVLPIRVPPPLFSSCFARRKRYSPKKPSGRLSTLRSPTHKPSYLVGSKLPSLTSRECVSYFFVGGLKLERGSLML